MNRWIANLLGIFSICAVCLIGWAAFRIGTLAGTVKAPDLTQTTAKLNQALDTINLPCATDAEKAAHKNHPCGTLGNIDKGIVKVGDLLVTSQNQEKDVAKAAEHNMAAVDGLASHLNTTADALTGTANSATGTLTAATGAIQTLTINAQTADDLLLQLKPLIASYTATGNDLDTTIKTANGIMASPNVTIMLANGAQFTTTAVQLEQKLAQCTLHPTLPCVLKSDILFGAQVGGYLLK